LTARRSSPSSSGRETRLRSRCGSPAARAIARSPLRAGSRGSA
jgi:hypothetical protein